MRTRYAIILLLLLSSFCACSDSNNQNQGDYPSLCAEFGVVHTNSDGQIFEATLDTGEHFYADSPVEVKWAATPDTLCRALVYHYPITKDIAEFRFFDRVLQVTPSPLKEGEQMYEDPVEWISSWVSPNKAFLNLCINIKAGVNAEGELEPQRLGLVLDNSTDDESKVHYVRLFHEQRSVPEYYTFPTYISIPLGDLIKVGDIVDFTVNTYKGVEHRQIAVK